jgi:hypothetical protein
MAACFAIGVCLGARESPAVPIIDQNQPSNQLDLADFFQGDLAQSFQQSAGNISGAGVGMGLGAPGAGLTDTVTIALWDRLPNQPGAIVLASAGGTATLGSWFDVFWSPVPTAAGVTYYLVFTSLSDTLAIAGDIRNPYASGQAYANTGFGAFPDFDYTFRTYAETDFEPVPEPTTLLLLGGGVLTLARLRRR